MNKTYYHDKKILEKDDIGKMLIFFSNGDYVNILRKEIKSLTIALSDRLIWRENAICPVGVGGEIQLSINNKQSDYTYSHVFVCDKKEYAKSRKSYIENKCLRERITHVRLFNDNNWHDTVYGYITATINDGIITLSFANVFNEPKDDTKCYIRLNDTLKSNIIKFKLDFENCEEFDVYQEEIEEMQLNYSEKLVWGSGDLNREIINGYILLHFQDLDYRDTVLFNDKKHTRVKDLMARLCGKNYTIYHDICHLYIEYDCVDFGAERQECVEINDIRPTEELYENENYESSPYFIGGYCRKINKNTVLICFGKKSERLIERLKFGNQ